MGEYVAVGAVGVSVGAAVGAKEGVWVGLAVGMGVGIAVGKAVGSRVGATLGDGVGAADGDGVGLAEGTAVGAIVGGLSTTKASSSRLATKALRPSGLTATPRAPNKPSTGTHRPEHADILLLSMNTLFSASALVLLVSRLNTATAWSK